MSWQKAMRKVLNTEYTEQHFLFLPIWHNSLVKVNKRPVYIDQWYRKGVRIIGDFIHGETFLTKDEFESKFGLQGICWLTYHGILSSLSKLFRSRKITLNLQPDLIAPFIPPLYHVLIKHEKCCKHVYNFLSSKQISPTGIIRWNNKFNLHIVPEDVFKICFKITEDTKIQWFQFRLLHRILPVGQYLKKIGATNNELCSFCDHSVESLEHVFFNCDTASAIWDNLEYIIFEKTNTVVHFDFSMVMFGVLSNQYPYKDTLNFIIIYTKFYMYINLKKHDLPNMNGLISFLSQNFKIQRFIACKHDKISLFDDKWNLWRNIFDYDS